VKNPYKVKNYKYQIVSVVDGKAYVTVKHKEHEFGFETSATAEDLEAEILARIVSQADPKPATDLTPTALITVDLGP